jgi:hypothetical protein
MPQHKNLRDVRIKNADQGTFSAVFSTFNVKDHDGDVTLPGAFDEGAPVVISSYNHTSWGGSRPVGKGTIRTTKSEAVVDGQFFMETTDGRETFAVVKGLAESGLGEWSYGFEVQESEPGKHDGAEVKFLKKVKVFECSPVLRGAGLNTRTLAVKALAETGMEMKEATRLAERVIMKAEYRQAIRPHFSASDTKTWDADAVVAAIPDDASIEDLRSIFAWVNPNGDPTMKGAYEIPHHYAAGAEVNLRACYMGIHALNTGKITIPEEDRQGVHAHLAGHILDADREPLPLRSVSEDGAKTFQEHIVHALAVNAELRKRASEVMALRARKGKSLASASSDLLEWWSDEMKESRAVLDSPQADAMREYLRAVERELFSDTEDAGENTGDDTDVRED